MSSFFRAYHKLVSKHTTAANIIQTAILMASGDVIAQTIVEKKSRSQYDPMRTLHFAMIGAGFVGPAISAWYIVLRKNFGSTGLSTTVKKVACDQLLFAPAFIAVLITSLNTLEGKTMEHIKHEFRTKYVDILLTNWKIWPAVQLCNFYLTPFQYQVLVVQVVALFWNAYLSFMTQKEID